jgi:hypothetical protein
MNQLAKSLRKKCSVACEAFPDACWRRCGLPCAVIRRIAALRLRRTGTYPSEYCCEYASSARLASPHPGGLSG